MAIVPHGFGDVTPCLRRQAHFPWRPWRVPSLAARGRTRMPAAGGARLGEADALVSVGVGAPVWQVDGAG